MGAEDLRGRRWVRSAVEVLMWSKRRRQLHIRRSFVEAREHFKIALRPTTGASNTIVKKLQFTVATEEGTLEPRTSVN